MWWNTPKHAEAISLVALDAKCGGWAWGVQFQGKIIGSGSRVQNTTNYMIFDTNNCGEFEVAPGMIEVFSSTPKSSVKGPGQAEWQPELRGMLILWADYRHMPNMRTAVSGWGWVKCGHRSSFELWTVSVHSCGRRDELHARVGLPASDRSQDWLQAPEQLLTCWCGSWISGRHWLEQLCWGQRDKTVLRQLESANVEPRGVISSRIFRGLQ